MIFYEMQQLYSSYWKLLNNFLKISISNQLLTFKNRQIHSLSFYHCNPNHTQVRVEKAKEKILGSGNSLNFPFLSRKLYQKISLNWKLSRCNWKMRKFSRNIFHRQCGVVAKKIIRDGNIFSDSWDVKRCNPQNSFWRSTKSSKRKKVENCS